MISRNTVIDICRTIKLKTRKNLDTNVIFRATGETKQKAEALKSLLKVSSTSAVFRKLLDDKAAEYGLGTD